MCSAVIPLHSSLGMSTFMIFCWFRSLLFDIEGIEGWKYYRCQLSVMNFIRCYNMIPNCIDFDVWYSLSHFIMRKLSGNSFLFNFLSDECQLSKIFNFSLLLILSINKYLIFIVMFSISKTNVVWGELRFTFRWLSFWHPYTPRLGPPPQSALLLLASI